MWVLGRGEGRHLPRFHSSHPTPPPSPRAVSPPLLELRTVTKRFGDFAAVDDLSLAIAAGRVPHVPRRLGLGQDHHPPHDRRLRAAHRRRDPGWRAQPITALPPFKRDINTVFQHYALFPHMSVRDNVGYGLRMRQRAARRRSRPRVDEALEMVSSTHLAGRAPTPALRRAAAAGGAGPRAGQPAPGAAAGRAARARSTSSCGRRCSSSSSSSTGSSASRSSTSPTTRKRRSPCPTGSP